MQTFQEPEPPHDLPRTLLSLPCYEPAGRKIELTGEALSRNTVLCGAIGSGKTSTLNQMLSQLIHYRADEAMSKIGLLVFDFKQDGTTDRIRQWAEEAGRSADLKILSADSDTRLELFDGFNSLAELETVVESLSTAMPREQGDNIYWEYARRKRLTDSLGLYRLVHAGPLYAPDVICFIRDFMMSGINGYERQSPPSEVEQFEALYEALPDDLPEQLRLSIQRIHAGLTEWKALDGRTRSNEQSTMSNFLNTLGGYTTYDYLGGADKSVIRIAPIVDEGAIVVLSVPALQHPELAATLGRWIKSRFYAKLQSRELDYQSPGRMVGLIMDEYPLIATGGESRFSDVTQLQAMRSMRGFAIAATQGFEALNRVLGQSEATALLAQFDQHFIFQSKEAAVAQWTRQLWGHETRLTRYPMPPTRRETSTAFHYTGEGAASYIDKERLPRVDLRELAALEPGQAWVWSPTTRDSRQPCWLVPLHASIKKEAARSTPSHLDSEERLRALLQTSKDPPLEERFAQAPPEPKANETLLTWEDFYPEELKQKDA